MIDARSNGYARIDMISRAGLNLPYYWKCRPFKVVVCAITLVAFLFNIVSYDIAWAARTPSELTSVGTDRAVSPGLSSEARRAKEDAFKELNPATFTLPAYLGTIKDSWSPSVIARSAEGATKQSQSRTTIIHIQDAHCNYYAQHKIAEIIEYLNKQYGINTVNLEGGAKDYDISIFTDVKDKNVREKAADYFVKEGVVNGAEYFAINNPEKVTLWGIEDVRLYIDNLKTYRNSLKYKDEVDKYFKNLSYILSNLKIKIYSKELLELDSRYNAYKVNNADFKDYLGYLMQKAKERLIDIKSYTNIYLLSQTLGQESGIDFRKANNERDELIDKLGKRLSKNALEELVLKTVEFKSERISQADFYQYLANKAKSINLKLDDFPELKKYSVYVATYQATDKAKIMDEVTSLEDKLKASLFTNDKDKELDVLSKNLALMKNMFNISLTREDYKYYQANERSFEMRNFTKFIEREAPLCKIHAKLDGNIAKLDDYRENICKFYEYSFKRDAAFMKNIRDCPPSRGLTKVGTVPISILITGGFHTENLTEIFKKQGISYVSIIPNFKNSDDYDCPYFKILSGEKNLWIKDALPSVLNRSLAILAQMSPKMVEEAGKAGLPVPTGIGKVALSADIQRFRDAMFRIDATNENIRSRLDEISKLISQFEIRLVGEYYVAARPTFGMPDRKVQVGAIVNDSGWDQKQHFMVFTEDGKVSGVAISSLLLQYPPTTDWAANGQEFHLIPSDHKLFNEIVEVLKGQKIVSGGNILAINEAEHRYITVGIPDGVFASDKSELEMLFTEDPIFRNLSGFIMEHDNRFSFSEFIILALSDHPLSAFHVTDRNNSLKRFGNGVMHKDIVHEMMHEVFDICKDAAQKDDFRKKNNYKLNSRDTRLGDIYRALSGYLRGRKDALQAGKSSYPSGDVNNPDDELISEAASYLLDSIMTKSSATKNPDKMYVMGRVNPSGEDVAFFRELGLLPSNTIYLDNGGITFAPSAAPTSAPTISVSARDVSKEDRAAIIDMFNTLKESMYEHGGRKMVLPQRDVDLFAHDLKSGKKLLRDIYDELQAALNAQFDIISCDMGPTTPQLQAIEEAEGMLGQYLGSLGIPFHSIRVAFVPDILMPTDEWGHIFNVYQTAIFSQNADGRQLLEGILHETLHGNSYGFYPKKLNEGMTEYLALKLMMMREGYEHMSTENIMEYYMTMDKWAYVFEVAAICGLIEAVGETPLLEAYFKGNYTPLEEALGKSKWNKIEQLAYQSEEYHDTTANETYLKRMFELVSVPPAGAAPSAAVAPITAAKKPDTGSWFPDNEEWTRNAWLRETGVSLFVGGIAWVILSLAGLQDYATYIVPTVSALTFQIPHRTRVFNPTVLFLTAATLGAVFLVITNPILGVIVIVGLAITHRHINLDNLSQTPAPSATSLESKANDIIAAHPELADFRPIIRALTDKYGDIENWHALRGLELGPGDKTGLLEYLLSRNVDVHGVDRKVGDGDKVSKTADYNDFFTAQTAPESLDFIYGRLSLYAFGLNETPTPNVRAEKIWTRYSPLNKALKSGGIVVIARYTGEEDQGHLSDKELKQLGFELVRPAEEIAGMAPMTVTVLRKIGPAMRAAAIAPSAAESNHILSKITKFFSDLNGGLSREQSLIARQETERIVKWWFRDKSEIEQQEIVHDISNRISGWGWKEYFQYIYDLITRKSLVDKVYGIERLLLASAALSLVFGSIVIIFDNRLTWMGRIIAIVVAYLITGVAKPLLISIEGHGRYNNRQKKIFINPGLEDNFLPGVVAHEIIHLLAARYGNPNDIPFASAVGLLRTVTVDNEGSLLPEEYKETFEKGRKLAREHIGIARFQKAVEFIHDKYADKSMGADWEAVQLKYSYAGNKEKAWTYRLGGVVAGIAYEIGLQHGSTDVSWEYLRRLMRGEDPNDIEGTLAPVVPAPTTAVAPAVTTPSVIVKVGKLSISIDDFVTTKEGIKNKYGGGEVSVFDNELKGKDIAAWGDARPYIESDWKELESIAAENGLKGGAPEVLEKIAARMRELRKKAVEAIFNKGREKQAEELSFELAGYAPIDINSGWYKSLRILKGKNRWASFVIFELKEKNGIWYRRGIKKVSPERAKELEKQRSILLYGMPSFESKYYVQLVTEYRTQRNPGNPDAEILYKDRNGVTRCMRLNEIQIKLAEKGIFYKGDTPSEYKGPGANNSDQYYPHSPREFWDEHMGAAVAPAAAKQAGTGEHAGFGIAMKKGTKAYCDESVTEARKERLNKLLSRGRVPKGFTKESIEIDGTNVNVIVNNKVMDRLRSEGKTPQQFIDECISIRGPPLREKLKTEFAKRKQVILDFVNKSTSLYGNCQQDGYIYINAHAPTTLDVIGVSHELMHEAGLAGNGKQDEIALAREDARIMVKMGIKMPDVQKELSGRTNFTSDLFRYSRLIKSVMDTNEEPGIVTIGEETKSKFDKGDIADIVIRGGKEDLLEALYDLMKCCGADSIKIMDDADNSIMFLDSSGKEMVKIHFSEKSFGSIRSKIGLMLKMLNPEEIEKLFTEGSTKEFDSGFYKANEFRFRIGFGLENGMKFMQISRTIQGVGEARPVTEAARRTIGASDLRILVPEGPMRGNEALLETNLRAELAGYGYTGEALNEEVAKVMNFRVGQNPYGYSRNDATPSLIPQRNKVGNEFAGFIANNKNKKEMTLTFIGVGRKPFEIKFTLDALVSQLKSAGENPADWTIHVYALDADMDPDRRVLPVTTDAAVTHQFSITLRNDEGIESLEGRIKADINCRKINVFNKKDMQKIPPSDFVFFRHLLYMPTYYHSIIEDKVNSKEAAESPKNLLNFIALLHIFSMSKPGTILVTEPSSDISDQTPASQKPMIAYPGTSTETGTGIYRIDEPGALSNMTPDGLRDYVISHAAPAAKAAAVAPAPKTRHAQSVTIVNAGEFKYFNPAMLVTNGKLVCLFARRVAKGDNTSHWHKSDIVRLKPVGETGTEFEVDEKFLIEGAEDPRVMRVEGEYGMTFVRPENEGHSWHSRFVKLKEDGTLKSPGEEFRLGNPNINSKNAYLVELPEGKIAFIDRANEGTERPAIQVYMFNNLKEALATPAEYWANNGVEAATILRPEGGIAHVGFNTIIGEVPYNDGKAYLALAHRAKAGLTYTAKEYTTAIILLRLNPNTGRLELLGRPVELPQPEVKQEGDVIGVNYETAAGIITKDGVPVVVSYAGINDFSMDRIDEKSLKELLEIFSDGQVSVPAEVNDWNSRIANYVKWASLQTLAGLNDSEKDLAVDVASTIIALSETTQMNDYFIGLELKNFGFDVPPDLNSLTNDKVMEILEKYLKEREASIKDIDIIKTAIIDLINEWRMRDKTLLEKFDALIKPYPELGKEAIIQRLRSALTNLAPGADKEAAEILNMLKYAIGVCVSARDLLNSTNVPDKPTFMFIPILSDKLSKLEPDVMRREAQDALKSVKDDLWRGFRINTITVVFYNGAIEDGSKDDLRTKMALQPDLRQDNTIIYIDGNKNEAGSYKTISKDFVTVRDIAREGGSFRTGYISVRGHVTLGLGLLQIMKTPDDNAYYQKILGLMARLSYNGYGVESLPRDAKRFIEALKNGDLNIMLPPMKEENINENMRDYIATETAAMKSV